MTQYRVTNLSDKTPKMEQDKLRTELKAMKGVDKVEIFPVKSEISISFKDKTPEKSVLAAAVTKAGFSLGAAV
ncbi:MAG: hypothetical protein IPK13_10560 [Deltaproteobacteria bacterium]|nr:hypothetical protein [Deltaproteobacteria bacterium]